MVTRSSKWQPPIGPILGECLQSLLFWKADGTAPVKQRQTAERISKRLRNEHGYGGGLTAVEDYVLIAWGWLRKTFRTRRGNAVGVSCGSVR